jgi:hypothetical protein
MEEQVAHCSCGDLPAPSLSLDELTALDEFDNDEQGFLRYLQTLDDSTEDAPAMNAMPPPFEGTLVGPAQGVQDASHQSDEEGARIASARPTRQLERLRAKNRRAQSKYRSRLKVRRGVGIGDPPPPNAHQQLCQRCKAVAGGSLGVPCTCGLHDPAFTPA